MYRYIYYNIQLPLYWVCKQKKINDIYIHLFKCNFVVLYSLLIPLESI